LGVSYKELKEYDLAIKSYEKAIDLRPEYADAHFNLGIILSDYGRLDSAIDFYKKAIKADSKYTEAYNNLGLILLESGILDEAKNYFENASIINPKDALAFNHLGIVYRRLHNLNDSAKCFEKAITINPSYPDAFANLGNVLKDLNSFDKALTNYQRAYELNSNLDYLLGNILHTQMHLCSWDDYSRQLKDLEVQINDNLKRVDAFTFMALSDNPRLQQKVSEIYAKDKFPKSNILPEIDIYTGHKKIRVGYFSGDFREHPVSSLTANLYETHNRDQFEIYAFSFGSDTNDKMNLRIKSGVDHFHDVQSKSHKDIVLLARSLEIDIAVDLGGLTASAKTEIFAMSVAPIQLSYIGFLGTMGAPYYDYLIADPITIPKENQYYYSEKIAYLPSYQINDSTEAPPEVFFKRKDIGLPETGFVFCCFNNTYKITPDTFDSWMRILKSVKDSVLMIYVDLDSAKENLMNEASLRAVDPNRIIFAKRLDRAQYLARYRVVDLFLDTLPYNAATTASDALRMGLPVLTCQGESFASRMAASVISALNLSELITDTRQEYESLAIELATSPKKFKAIKEKLNINLSTAPLYDTGKFTEHLESVYTIMYQRYHDGLEPDHIYSDDFE
jgi:predicted O-linked N-acetylglucosamine transferase (SPINDLY family)